MAGCSWALGGCGSDEAARTRTEGPVVIIGTGFGGSVAAFRLAQAGIDTIVFERGKRWDIQADGNTFPTLAMPDGRSSWLNPDFDLPVIPGRVTVDKYVGVLEVIESSAGNMAVVAGAGVGGGSLIYGGTLVQPTERAFRRSLPAEIDYGEMDAVYYPRARQMLGASVVPEDILEHPNYQWTKTAVAEVDASGLTKSPAPAGFDWDVVRAELRGEVVAALTVGEYAIAGCNSGATNSTGRNYLLLAEQTGRADVRTLHSVQYVEQTTRGYTVHVDHISETGETVEKLQIEAKRVFFAAGAMGTTRLLLRSKARGGLVLGDEVGQSWATNGDSLALRSNTGLMEGVHAGPPAVMASREDDSEITGMEYANGPGSLMATLGMTVLDEHGRITFDEELDDIDFIWPDSAQARVDAAVQGLHDSVNAGNPGSSAMSFGRPNTYHPLGGAVMGQVCDFHGRVLGHSGLYVIDGALIPGYTGARNPALTITALAERAMDDILEKDG